MRIGFCLSLFALSAVHVKFDVWNESYTTLCFSFWIYDSWKSRFNGEFCFLPTLPQKPEFSESQRIDCKPHLSFRRFFIDFSWEKKELSNQILLLKSSQQNRRDITGKRTIDKELFFQANKNSYSTYSYFDSSARIEQFRTFDASQLRVSQENYWNWQ